MNSSVPKKVSLVVLKLLGMALGYFVVLFVLSLVWVLFSGIDNFPDSLNESLVFLQAISGVVFLLLLRRFYRKRGLDFKKSAGLTSAGLVLPEYAIIAAGGVLFNLFFVILLNLLPYTMAVGYRVSVQSALTATGGLMSIFAILVFAPVVEEIVFRGFCLKYLRSCLSPYRAAAIISVVFGALHAQPIWMVYTMLMGMVFSVLTIRVGSIYPAIVMHFSFNASSLVLFLAAMRSAADWPFGLSLPAVLFLLVVVAAVAGLIGIKIYKLTGRDMADGA